MLRAGLILVFISVTAFAQFPTYSVAVIPAPSGLTGVSMTGINNTGQVAGQGNNGTGTQSFVGSASGSTAIPLPSGWVNAYGQAVNNLGQVAGWGNTGTGGQGSIAGQAFIGTGAGSTLIPLPAGLTTVYGYGVNDSGQVAGYSSSGEIVIGTITGSTAIPAPSGWTFAIALGVNNSGQIAGYLEGSSVNQAFITTTAGITPVPLPSGVLTAVGYAVNDLGQVAGIANTGANSQAFIGTTSASSVIPLPVGATYALMSLSGSINNSGMVVGYSNVGGWIWDAANGTVLLNSLVPTGWNVSNGISTSNNGHILAQASFNGGAVQYVDLFPAGSPSAPILDYPVNGSIGTPMALTLKWETPIGATSYDVYLGTSPSPALVTNVTTNSYTPPRLASNTTYYWQVVARNSVGAASSVVYSFTTFDSTCTFSASPSSLAISYLGGPAQVNVSAGVGCSWIAASSAPWLTITSGSAGNGNGTIFVAAGSNPGSAQLGYISFANQNVGVMQGGLPSAPIFNDVPSADPYFDYVSLMSTYGITVGCQASPPLYCPTSPVTRAEMAVFIVRGVNLATNASLTYPTTAYFQDLPSSGITDSEYFPYVQRLAQLGITVGCQTSPALFCPDESIPQGEMAVFVIRAWMLANNITSLTYPTTPYFTDVPATDEYFPYIQKMAQLGFWTGCGGGAYCENSVVTRDQMAPMILRGTLGAP